MSLVNAYLNLWGTVHSKVTKQTKRIQAITYGIVLFCSVLSVFLFLISAVELVAGLRVPLWIQTIPYLIASYTGLVGWYYGNL